MPKFKVEDMLRELADPNHIDFWEPNHPDTIRYRELFTELGMLDTEEFTYNGKPMTDEQKEFIIGRNESEYSQVILSTEESEYVPILDNVIARLESNEIIVDDKYRNLLSQMARAMAQTVSTKRPNIITARPGLGKTQMLIATLIEKLRMSAGYSAFVITGRVEDGLSIAEEVDREFKEDICLVRPTFTLMTLNGRTCMNGHVKGDHHNSICHSKNCKQDTCPAKPFNWDFKEHKIVLCTTTFFNMVLDAGKLDQVLEMPSKYEYVEYTEEDKVLTDDSGNYVAGKVKEQFDFWRNDLFIDENPGMIFNPSITNEMLNHCMVHLRESEFDQPHILEFATIMGVISPLIGGKVQYEYVDIDDAAKSLTSGFTKAWRENYHPDYYNLPEIVNHFIEAGGIRQNRNKGKIKIIDYAIGINRYRSISPLMTRTVILDGTGIKDLTYRSSDFNILELSEIRDFARGTLHRYPKTISKSFLSDSRTRTNRIKRIADEAIRVIKDTKALFITYMNDEDDFKKLLKPYPNIEVNHFGNLIGRNDYSKCTSVFFAGTNDWGPMEYFSEVSAVMGERVDLTIVQNKPTPYASDEVNEFYSTLIALGLYQDLMRCNLRVASSDKEVNLYLWTRNDQIMDQVVSWLPGIAVKVESVPDTLRSSRQSKSISTETLLLLDKLKKSMSPADFQLKTKLRYIKIAEYLGRVPDRIELEYVWADINIGQYSRDVKHAIKYLKAIQLPNS